MTATDELRAMLDKRGVEYEGETDEDGWAFTRWHGFDNTGWLAVSDELCGLLDLRGRYLFTPEQAIAATLGAGTLGAGTCHEVMIDKFFRGCSECGYMWEYMYGIGNRSGPNFCPKCGARVVRA